MPDDASRELPCDCGHCVLDLSGLEPGSTVRCSFCGKQHTVPGAERTSDSPSPESAVEDPADGSSRAEREEALMAELKSSGPSDEDLEDLMRELDREKRLSDKVRRGSDDLSAHLPDPTTQRRWNVIAAYVGGIVIVGLIVYVRFFTGESRGGGLAIDWRRYSAGTWALIVLAGAALGFGLYLVYTWFFVYMPRRRSKRSPPSRRRRDDQVV